MTFLSVSVSLPDMENRLGIFNYFVQCNKVLKFMGSDFENNLEMEESPYFGSRFSRRGL